MVTSRYAYAPVAVAGAAGAEVLFSLAAALDVPRAHEAFVRATRSWRKLVEVTDRTEVSSRHHELLIDHSRVPIEHSRSARTTRCDVASPVRDTTSTYLVGPARRRAGTLADAVPN